MPANLEDSAVAWDWKVSVFIPIPKKGNAKECSNYPTIALSSHARKECSKCSKPGLICTWTKNFQMFLGLICTWTKNFQMFLNQEHGLILTFIHDNIHVLGSGTSGFRQGSRTRDQIANVHWIIEKSREFQKKKIYLSFIDYAKAFDSVDCNKLWKILKKMGIPDHFTCLLRSRSNS